jgi:Flp pilus assembly protein TadG
MRSPVLWTRRQSRTSQRSGAALVEFAIVLPVFFLLILGIIEFGRAFMVGQLVTNAAREGARQAVLDGSTNTAVTSTITSFLQGAGNISPTNVTVTITVSTAAAVNQLANAKSGDLCTIRVSVPFNQVSYLTPSYMATTNLVGQSVMRHE